MAIVKMRDLLRTPKPVFEELERSREPALLTRDGKPVAALFPVDSDQAYELAMAALPEFVQSRERAEHARGEGRTGTAAEFLRDFEARHGGTGNAPPTTPVTTAAKPEDASSLPGSASDVDVEVGVGDEDDELIRAAEELGVDLSGLGQTFAADAATEGADVAEAGPIPELRRFFGEELSRELAGEVEQRIAAASEPICKFVPRETPRIEQLNCEMFGRMLPGEIRRIAFGLLSSDTPNPKTSGEEGVLGRPLAEQTLDAVTERVKSFNCELIDDRTVGMPFSLERYASRVHATPLSEVLDAHIQGMPQHRSAG